MCTFSNAYFDEYYTSIEKYYTIYKIYYKCSTYICKKNILWYLPSTPRHYGESINYNIYKYHFY